MFFHAAYWTNSDNIPRNSMISFQKSKLNPDSDTKRLSQKELAKQYSQAAYQRAKEFRKTDPKQIAMAEKLKEQRKAAYRLAKERNKAYTAEMKKTAGERVVGRKSVTQVKKVGKTLVPRSGI